MQTRRMQTDRCKPQRKVAPQLNQRNIFEYKKGETISPFSYGRVNDSLNNLALYRHQTLQMGQLGSYLQSLALKKVA